MPEDVLERLLEAERKAEAVVENAKTEQSRIVEEAHREARSIEQSFEARVPEIRALWLKKAEDRAEQTVRELGRRFQERQKELRRLAEGHEDEAIRAVVALLTSPDRCD